MLILAFIIIFAFVYINVKKVLPEGPGLLSSRVMFMFAISSRKYTIALYTPEHLEIIWELFAKKSADILSFRNSFYYYV